MEEEDNINISEIRNVNEWENFNLQNPYPSYFQSWYWGEALRNAGYRIIRLGVFRQNKLISIAQVVVIYATRGNFYHIRQGPVFTRFNFGILNKFIKYLKKRSKKDKVSFIRISPLLVFDQKIEEAFKKEEFILSPLHLQDGVNRWVLDLSPSVNQLLSDMRKTTRYLIKKGEKEGIQVKKEIYNLTSFKQFMMLYQDTADAKNFVAHSMIQEEMDAFTKYSKAFLYTSYLNKKPLASAIIIYYGNEAIYRHGATSKDGRKTPASYLLQWQALQDAKGAGLTLYNFWGIADSDSPKHPWFGLSQFKKGFGGRNIEFIRPFDYPFSLRYYFTYCIDYLTKLGKGY